MGGAPEPWRVSALLPTPLADDAALEALALALARVVDPSFVIAGPRVVAPSVTHVIPADAAGPAGTEDVRRTTLGGGATPGVVLEITERRVVWEDVTSRGEHSHVAAVRGLAAGVELWVDRLRSSVYASAPREDLLLPLAEHLARGAARVTWAPRALALPDIDRLPGLLARLGARWRPPVTPEALADAARSLGAPLPRELAALYAAADGGTLDGWGSVELVPLSRAVQERALPSPLVPFDRLPLLVDPSVDAKVRQLVVLAGPLEGRVLLHGIDGALSLTSPSIVTFLEQLARAVETPHEAIYGYGGIADLPSWYSERPIERTRADAEAASALDRTHSASLRAGAGASEKAWFGHRTAIELACTLAPAGDLQQLGRWLYTKGVERAAAARLRRIGTKDALGLVEAREQRFVALAERLRSVAAKRGAEWVVRAGPTGPVLDRFGGVRWHPLPLDSLHLERAQTEEVQRWVDRQIEAARALDREAPARSAAAQPPRLVLDPDRTVVVARGEVRCRVEGLVLPVFEKTPEGTEVWASLTLSIDARDVWTLTLLLASDDGFGSVVLPGGRTLVSRDAGRTWGAGAPSGGPAIATLSNET